MKAKGYRVAYTEKFDLSELPAYAPTEKVTGTIRLWGSNYFTDSPLAGWWEEEFKKFHPDVKFDFHLNTTPHAIPGLIFGMSDIGPMGREIMWDELLSFQREHKRLPTGISAVTGSYDVSGWNPAIGVFVHRDNPLAQLSLAQLDGIFGAERSGAWRALTWDKSLARGPEKNLRTWGQLGVTGPLASQPIPTYGPPLLGPGAITFFQARVFDGGAMWNENFREYADRAQMIADLARDPLGIAYAPLAYATPGVKTVALAETSAGPYVALTRETVANRTYPLHRPVYLYFTIDNKKSDLSPTRGDPRVREFIRYILRREGQPDVAREGSYLPLPLAPVREQLAKLDAKEIPPERNVLEK